MQPPKFIFLTLKLQPHSLLKHALKSIYIPSLDSHLKNHHMRPTINLHSTENSTTNTPYATTKIHLFTIRNSVTFSIETHTQIQPHSLIGFSP